MLEHQDFLALMAELAVAMAGFTGIVALFQRREPGKVGGHNFALLLLAKNQAEND
jgi:hypothetical protein